MVATRFAHRLIRHSPWLMNDKTVVDRRSLLRTLMLVTTVTATKARSALYALIDEANRSHEPIQITGKRGNAVLISEEDWRSIEETLFLNSIPGMVESINEAREEGIDGASEEFGQGSTLGAGYARRSKEIRSDSGRPDGPEQNLF